VECITWLKEVFAILALAKEACVDKLLF